MYYTNFDDHITLKFGVVIEGWPLKTFACPGSFSSIPTLTILYNAWLNDVASFRSLSDTEWTAWKKAYDTGVYPPGVTMAAFAIPADTTTGENEDANTASLTATDATGATEQSDGTAAAHGTSSSASSSAGTGVSAVSVDSSTPSGSPPVPELEPSSVTNANNKRPLQDVFINTFATDSSLVVMKKKTRKTCKDKRGNDAEDVGATPPITASVPLGGSAEGPVASPAV